MLLDIPALVTPRSADLVGLLPELILGGGFLLVMLLDLALPAGRRGYLASLSLVTVAAAIGATVWGWFDVGDGRTVYFNSFAYDRFSLFVDVILLSSTALVLLISPQYLRRRSIHHGEYYALLLAATTGMMLLAGAASLMVIFLGVELLSISLYILSGFSRRDERSQEAAFKYLLLGGFASGFLLYGMALIYGETGHTQLAQIFAAVSVSAGSGPDPLLLVGIVMMFIGLAFKVSAAPFHSWTPDVYQGAPTAVTAFMSVATKVAAFAAIIRVFTYALPHEFERWHVIVGLIAILSMVVGNVAALPQTSVKRMLAYSGIAQAGYILIGVAVLDPDGSATSGALFYLAAYTVTNLGAFAVITIMAGRGEDLDSYDGLRGLASRRRSVAGVMALCLLSLAGFPPTVGFFGKFFVFLAAVKAGQVPLALWGIGTSAISAFYYLRVILIMYARPAGEPYRWSRTSAAGGIVLLLTTAGIIVFGVFSTLLYSIATDISRHGVVLGFG